MAASSSPPPAFADQLVREALAVGFTDFTPATVDKARLCLAGAVIERALDDVIPASPELIVGRFMTNARAAWGEDHAEAVRKYIFEMEAQTDLRALNAMLSRAAGAASDTGETA